jgi:hypothetical protein
VKKSGPIGALALVLFHLISAGCSDSSAPGPEIHDSKYVTLDDQGNQTGGPPGEGDCVLDQFVGLTWEVKSDSPGLRDWRNTYSWFNPDESHDGELDYRGAADAGKCSGSACDTWAFVTAVNEAGYCGHTDWRIPSRDELASISDPRKKKSPPTTNMRYFPFMQPDEYWSRNDYHFQWNAAWLWNYLHGHDRVEWKESPRLVRLVRGESVYLERVED